MILKINGQTKTFSVDVQTVADLLSALDIKQPERVAVEINRKIVMPATFHQAPVCENDNIEIVTFVGGG